MHNENTPDKNRINKDLPLKTPVQKKLLAIGLLLSLILLSAAFFSGGDIQAVLFLIGLALGFTLLHARFGFTSAFRRLVAVGNPEALKAHLLMLAAASVLFALILNSHFSFTGIDPKGYVSPVGISVVFGAFLFGIGMQLGGGCASGTLYSLGGGSSSMILTLVSFIAGATIGAAHLSFWQNDTPSLPPISLAESTGFGYFWGLILQLALLAAIYWAAVQIAKRKNPPALRPLPKAEGWKRIVRGSWPLYSAALVLAVLNALILTIRGEPWGITSAFSLWGSKFLMIFGGDPSQWGYFAGGKAQALQVSIFKDSTSMLNFGIILGAFLASAAAGTFKPKKIKPKIALASIIGGLLMGYGARLSFGCNIGAYFGGIASFSLHGWVWMIMALLGTAAALKLRTFFGLSNPKPNDSVC
ncbi:YeeE/YedE family protein [Metabacillus sp. GX 13764]|uniref:YeeE/YedE family protein n=1 Tax=Metabacillus kandeliae TaxID=2900151 RepID=UPI001E28ABF1|nr:YeeE/YedE family protein [Metabacillus kandeliae]MCD7033555.1 YeeE/YedE family protein [Metabacillus kandeliae]